LLSNSPECYLRVDGQIVRTLPIKGTRPRAGDRAKDRGLARDLARDAKERAEHLMIVDLERNDLGRVCRTGSVTVPAFAEVASFATVHHLVSEVRGCLREDVSLADMLRATFPGGSITGAPKIRAMEIIAEVEQAARGVYTGAIGFFNGPRSLELSIAIRTAIATADAVHYSTGGGIVADSRVDGEWEETVTKARAFMDTIGAPGIDRRAAGG
jgi:para-aminobenzoate synthetase component 1